LAPHVPDKSPIVTGRLGKPINSKLGPHIHSWSIPADTTCPGASRLCRDRCYAKRGFFVYPKVGQTLQRNEDFSRTEDFVPWMQASLISHAVRILRIHVSGDFYDADYAARWLQIVRRSRRVTFFVYTRSWRIDDILPSLIAVGREPNVNLWFSLDRETGSPPLIPGIRRAYMAINDYDAQTAPTDCDLVFRDHPKGPLKKANGVLVCPVENGVPGQHHHTCTTCGFCWNKQQQAKWEKVLLPKISGMDDAGIAINVPDQPLGQPIAKGVAHVGAQPQGRRKDSNRR
jgi:hypothetical protein